MQRILVCSLALVLLSAPIQAGPPDQKHINSIKKKVSHCLERSCVASIQTRDDRELRGNITEADPDTFILYNAGKSTSLSYADVRKFKSPLPEELRQLQGGLAGAAIAVIIIAIVVAIGGTRG